MGKRVLILDGYNLIHRARSGYSKGNWPICFNFFRGLRPIIEKHKPDVCYLTSEGVPVKRLEIFEEYKGTRVPMESEEYDSFSRQKDEIFSILRDFPITVLRHPNYEGDDIVSNIISRLHPNDDVTVVSNDTDFIQLLQLYNNVTLWNPMKKEFVSAPTYDYVKWKALVGDGSDNIPGVFGIGSKTAQAMLNNPILFDQKLSRKEARELYELCKTLIRFHILPDEEWAEIETTKGHASWDVVKAKFVGFEFNSMTKDSTWAKYTKTFGNLQHNSI